MHYIAESALVRKVAVHDRQGGLTSLDLLPSTTYIAIIFSQDKTHDVRIHDVFFTYEAAMKEKNNVLATYWPKEEVALLQTTLGEVRRRNLFDSKNNNLNPETCQLVHKMLQESWDYKRVN